MHVSLSVLNLWLRSDGTIPTRAWFINRYAPVFPIVIAGQSMRAGAQQPLLRRAQPQTLYRQLAVGLLKRLIVMYEKILFFLKPS